MFRTILYTLGIRLDSYDAARRRNIGSTPDTFANLTHCKETFSSTCPHLQYHVLHASCHRGSSLCVPTPRF